ncbi:MAG: VCBS domain-containing protein, partial [Clostridia bacterium]|nr:VCBS domain-containing protein [Clostridia bacterium]
LTEYKDGKNDWHVTYDENGNVTSADITYSDGAKMIKNADGTTTFTLPDGTKYESDGNGNITKDGEPLKKDGKWIDNKNSGNGKNKSDKSASENSNTGKNNSSNSKTAQQGGTGAAGVTINDIMGSWSYSSGDITENYTFSQANDTVTVVMTASKADGTTSNPVTFSCEYTFDGNVLVLSNSRWHNDMKLRLINKDSLEITSSGTFVLTRDK